MPVHNVIPATLTNQFRIRLVTLVTLMTRASIGAALLLLAAGACRPMPRASSSSTGGPATAVERPVRLLSLSGPITRADAELSALAWHGDTLVLVPQYPHRFGDVLFTLEKRTILDWLDGRTTAPLVPGTLSIDTTELQKIPGYEGLEALAVVGRRFVFTIEASPAGMDSYVVAADLEEDGRTLRLEANALVSCPTPVQLRNKSFESLLAVVDGFVALYEANGARVNPKPVAAVFGQDLARRGSVPFPSIEYRITDATSLDADGRFWAINTFWLGDLHLLPDVHHSVEQLVELRWTGAAIERTTAAPIRLQRVSDLETRNWEGLARLDDRGFLLASDKFPETLVGFVSLR